jgi:hypothetical protein
MFKKAISVFGPVAMIVALVLFFGAYSRTGGLFRRPVMPGGVALLRQVQTLSESVTVKYALEKIVDVKDVKWHEENRGVLIVRGTVKARVDFDKLEPADIQIAGKKITVNLPAPTVTGASLDGRQIRIYDPATGSFQPLGKDLEQAARQQAVDELRQLARDSDILKDAQESAKAQLTALFMQAGFTEVEINTR